MVKYIKRHDIFARITHWTFAVGGLGLMATGLFVFIPALANWAGPAMKGITIAHRVLAVLFIAIPVISWIIKPSNLIGSMKQLFMKWDDDDKEFMIKFFPYLLNPGKYHMPKQQFIKSGQRFSDMIMYLCIFGISLSGVLLWIGADAFSPELYALWRAGHDITFMGMAMMMPIHIYFGGGIFQPYRRLGRVMFGDGLVSESDALYHWGHWAEDELLSGENVVELDA